MKRAPIARTSIKMDFQFIFNFLGGDPQGLKLFH